MACTLIAVVAALIAGIAIGMALTEFKHMQERIDALEKAQAKHLPFKTADEIEESTAALLNLKFHNEFRGELIDNAIAHLQKARNGNGKGEK